MNNYNKSYVETYIQEVFLKTQPLLQAPENPTSRQQRVQVLLPPRTQRPQSRQTPLLH